MAAVESGLRVDQEAAADWLGSLAGGAARGASMGSVAGPWGALVGALAGAGLSAVQTAQGGGGRAPRPAARPPSPAGGMALAPRPMAPPAPAAAPAAGLPAALPAALSALTPALAGQLGNIDVQALLPLLAQLVASLPAARAAVPAAAPAPAPVVAAAPVAVAAEPAESESVILAGLLPAIRRVAGHLGEAATKLPVSESDDGSGRNQWDRFDDMPRRAALASGEHAGHHPDRFDDAAEHSHFTAMSPAFAALPFVWKEGDDEADEPGEAR